MEQTLLSSLLVLAAIVNTLEKEDSENLQETHKDEPQCSPVYARYLDANNDYSLVIQDEKLVVPENYIPIPTGADTFVVFEPGTAYFWKHIDIGNYFIGAGNTLIHYPKWVNTAFTAKDYVAEFSSDIPKIKWEDTEDQNSVGVTLDSNLYEYLDVAKNLELVLRTQDEAAQTDTLIPVPPDAEMAAVFTDPDQPLCFYKQIGGTVFAKDSKDTTWVATYWQSLDTLKEHVQHYNYEYWVRNTPEVHECMDKVKSSFTESTFRTAPEIADAALQHIRDRAATYDSPEGERSAAKTARAFNAITGKNITEAEVFLMLQILKDVRQWQIPHKTHKDSIEDCIAYAALKAEAVERNNTDPFTGLF
jgi:hypothetical protein